ncbi:hypothetical protein GO986_12130 [Deinococcus sp. HMF7620]|uniref:SAM-dependent methyltransferase n=1 Tax=Deinococcus arboris TaxID=2682977 RepID=A0A7C9HSC5_9DEIO|nr:MULTISPECIES: hypothetical protein [Deinococcus]MBZ9752135.1 hypothetical protein [Deinococcus betulae]MVN87513.1 hypothetical protein [Deinococcus arboris]
MTQHAPEKAAALLRRRAAGLETRAARKEEPRYVGQNMTRRRAAEADSVAADARKLRLLQGAYLAVAQGLEQGTLPEGLHGVTAPPLIERLISRRPDLAADLLEVLVSNEELAALQAQCPGEEVLHDIEAQPTQYGWRRAVPLSLIPELLALVDGLTDPFAGLPPHQPCLLPTLVTWRQVTDAGLTTPAHLVLAAECLHDLSQGRLNPVTAQRQHLAALERGLIGVRLPGFFPTPPALATQMVRWAELHPGLTLLEPQAGKGDLVDAALAAEPTLQVTVCERSGQLRDILSAKGYAPVGDDSMALRGRWERILMNPPFEQLADIDHIRHAASLLAPDGLLVAVVSESPFFRRETKAQAFRDWLTASQADVIQNDPDAFRVCTTGHSAGVQTRLIRLRATQLPL